MDTPHTSIAFTMGRDEQIIDIREALEAGPPTKSPKSPSSFGVVSVPFSDLEPQEMKELALVQTSRIAISRVQDTLVGSVFAFSLSAALGIFTSVFVYGADGADLLAVSFVIGAGLNIFSMVVSVVSEVQDFKKLGKLRQKNVSPSFWSSHKVYALFDIALSYVVLTAFRSEAWRQMVENVFVFVGPEGAPSLLLRSVVVSIVSLSVLLQATEAVASSFLSLMEDVADDLEESMALPCYSPPSPDFFTLSK
ncbi:hypothetical protein T439DRAFT_359784 [Meredithblackwellia eburnea MCA 4105]